MNVGQLRHKVIIQSLTETQNTYGEPIKTWATFATRRAAIKTVSGSEKMSSKQLNSEAKIIFTLRYLSGVTTKMRVSYDSRIFDIIAIDNGIERQKATLLECIEQT